MNQFQDGEKLPLSTKIFYLFGDIGISMCVAGVSFFILFFYADVSRIEPGMVAARLLVELGVPPEAAILRVRAARPCAIETPEQEAAVRQTARDAA